MLNLGRLTCTISSDINPIASVSVSRVRFAVMESVLMSLGSRMNMETLEFS